MIEKKCKICRRANKKLFLKGEKCFTPKCSFEKKPYAPGMPDSARKHRKTFSEYGFQLREKQKVKNIYRIKEKQFSNYVKDATSKHGTNPAESLYENLESRLDSVVFRAGFADSRSLARQIVSHGHITVNGRRVDVPSYRIKKGDVFEVRDNSKNKTLFSNLAEKLKKQTVVPWIKIDPIKLSGTIQEKPIFSKEDVNFNLTSVLEFYSR
jgi:small subunit ribosomal protein S4